MITLTENWEGGHIVEYADPEKIKKVASKYIEIEEVNILYGLI